MAIVSMPTSLWSPAPALAAGTVFLLLVEERVLFPLHFCLLPPLNGRIEVSPYPGGIPQSQGLFLRSWALFHAQFRRKNTWRGSRVVYLRFPIRGPFYSTFRSKKETSFSSGSPCGAPGEKSRLLA